MRSRPIASALLALLIAVSAVASMPAPTSAATGVLYVDGKTGNDAWDGSLSTRAFKTIAKAANALPNGSSAAGWKIVVKGYADYIYRERPVPPGWQRTGVEGAPITFEAAGYVAGTGVSYPMPIISGADALPAAGQTWSGTSVAGVWSTPLATAPFGYGKSGTSTLPTALFQNVRTWLWEQPSLSVLGTRAVTGAGGYWYDANAKRIYVSAASKSGSTVGTDPTGLAIDVIMRNGFLFDGRSGGDHMSVRGFEVRHSANGIAFLYGADYGTVADNLLTGNLYMGVSIAGYQTPSGPDGAVGFTVWRNRGTANTIQAIKLTNGASSASVCYNEAWGNGLQGIKIEGVTPGSGYTGRSTGITVCANRLHHQTFNPTGSSYNNASGITISNGVTNVTLRDNDFYANDVGVLVTQEATGMAAMNGIAITRNRMWGNRRFGLYFFDGYRGSGAGTMTASYDRIWGNGMGVMVDRGSSNKKLIHETIDGNAGDGIHIGGYQVTPASATITDSLITRNGGFGLWLVTGNSAVVAYTGLHANSRGAISGTPTKTAVNTNAPGYVSVDPVSSEHLRISSTSYQYTAGPSWMPIGARY